jgi:hypothetical protein
MLQNSGNRVHLYCFAIVSTFLSVHYFTTLREEHRLRVFENRVVRKIFGPKRDEMMGDWRNLHNEELHNLYSPNIIRMIKEDEMGRACSTNGGDEECM